jgi:tRNA threonylcarbamoyladenosine biosynthesis protein TsaE
MMFKQIVNSEEAMQKLGEELAQQIAAPCIIYLHGDLGAGKTTLVRGILRGLGYVGKVKSPTYTLVEAYQIAKQVIYHFDLYRLDDPEELGHIGFRDYLADSPIMLIEWPQKAQDFLPPANLKINIMIEDGQRMVEML